MTTSNNNTPFYEMFDKRYMRCCWIDGDIAFQYICGSKMAAFKKRMTKKIVEYSEKVLVPIVAFSEGGVDYDLEVVENIIDSISRGDNSYVNDSAKVAYYLNKHLSLIGMIDNLVKIKYFRFIIGEINISHRTRLEHDENFDYTVTEECLDVLHRVLHNNPALSYDSLNSGLKSNFKDTVNDEIQTKYVIIKYKPKF